MRKDLSSGFLTCPTLALFTQEESKIATTWRFRRYTVYHVGVTMATRQLLNIQDHRTETQTRYRDHRYLYFDVYVYWYMV